MYSLIHVTHHIAFALIEGSDGVVQFLDLDRHSAPEAGDVAFEAGRPSTQIAVCKSTI